MTSIARALPLTLAVALVIATSARADTLAAVAPAGDDVRKALLVGPSGQVWEPDGAGTWTRRAEGGVSADVRGAAVASSALIVAGKSAPLFRRDGDRWTAMRLGERGRTVVGTGPRPSLAIGKLVFVWTGTTWKRVGRTTGAITALWAASETKVYAGSDSALVKLAGGGGFGPIATGTPAVVALAGAVPWAVTGDGVYEVAARRAHRPTVGGAPLSVFLVTATVDTAWALGTTSTGPALARFHKGAWTDAVPPPLPADDPPLALIADTSGGLLVATRGGAVLFAGSDGAWTAGTRADALPVAPPGPGPARGR